MEFTCLCHTRTHPINTITKKFPKSSQMSYCRRLLRIPSSALRGVQSHGVIVGCMGWDSGDERVSERCKGRKGMVELLECLDTEAIMGEDQGRDPMDYNRRAQIFDTSSKVFQALKSHQRQS
ncbi:hypothetical protein E1A91_A06G196700v1 [Gossypium mustelinum]|uniref:Uncharacterized protein n=1 Tax=Gossypium mustelinum TaxID=34275 RepID=A0A5D2YZH5_GOSMU|nr:hypothetical protein E1A91_A06G196700v1 [Gossypium mustelinum]